MTDRPLQLCADTLSLCKGDEAQVTVMSERSLAYRFGGSQRDQATSVDGLVVEAMVVRDGRCGLAATTTASAEALRSCAERAAQAAELGTDTGARYPGLPVATVLASDLGFDTDTDQLDPEHGRSAAADARRAARQVEGTAHGLWSAASTVAAIASSRGTLLSHHRTDARMKVVCRIGGASGFASAASVASADLIALELGHRAARWAVQGRNPRELPRSDVTVIFEPAAVALMVAQLGHAAFDGRRHGFGGAGVSGAIGEMVASECVTIEDDPLAGFTLPLVFDREGVVKRPLHLVRNGVAEAVVHDISSAAAVGVPSSGHARSPGGTGDPPGPQNLHLHGGEASDLTELIAPVEQGVLVTRLWYPDVLDPRRTTFTAVTRDALCLIEDGRIVRPLRTCRLNDTLLGIFSRVEDLTRTPTLVPGEHLIGPRSFESAVFCPAIRVTTAHFDQGTGP